MEYVDMHIVQGYFLPW